MTTLEITDPLFRRAGAALDAGDLPGLERLLGEHPELASARHDGGEGYFRRPYLLWFVAENPIRVGRLPANAADLARAILRAVERRAPATLREQADYALSLVCSGSVARESGVQRGLIDALVDAGANATGAVLPAVSHRETGAVARLLERGAALTLPAAVAVGRLEDLAERAARADAGERRIALAAAALHGSAEAIGVLLAAGEDPNGFCPEGFHAHSTPLHQAVASGSLAAVRALAEAGAGRDVKDRVFGGTPLDWADHMERAEIARYLRGLDGDGGRQAV